MESVDVVDENDKVVGTVSKQEAHEKGLLHRTVIAEVRGSDGSWTLVRQSASRQDAGQIVSPIGGHVEAGESEDEAIVREAREEYGLEEKCEMKLIGKKVFYREVKGRKENHLFVVYEMYTEAEPKLNEESVESVKFTPDELGSELKMSPEKFGAAFHFVIKNFYPEMLA